MRISGWSSDVCSSDLGSNARRGLAEQDLLLLIGHRRVAGADFLAFAIRLDRRGACPDRVEPALEIGEIVQVLLLCFVGHDPRIASHRSEEHTSELQSLMRISYAVFCLKKKKQNNKQAEYMQNDNTKYTQKKQR